MKIDVQNSSGKVVETMKLDKKIFNVELNSSVVKASSAYQSCLICVKVHIVQKIDLLLEVEVKNHGSKKDEVLLELEQLDLLYGKVVVLFLVLSPHSYNKKLPKKMSKLARKSVLSKKLNDKEFIVLDRIDIASKKHLILLSFMKILNIQGQKDINSC